MPLLENYQNEIINEQMSNRRQYRMIENNNGTISFIDVTVYDREGSLFDADDINDITHQININTLEIEKLSQSIPLTGSFQVVDTLPTENISISTIYLVPDGETEHSKSEFVSILSPVWEDYTSMSVIVPDINDLPEIGNTGMYYLIRNSGEVYIWNDEWYKDDNHEANWVGALPLSPFDTVFYVLISDNTVNYSNTFTQEWEQIGSTTIDLTRYYTKTQLDNGALITTTEFESL